MKVVIDVPNWLYFAILEHKEPVYSQSLGDAVRDGMPLPKGHGDLIDRYALWNRMSRYSDDEGAVVDYLNDDVNPIILRDSAMEVIENAPTIIPATKGE